MSYSEIVISNYVINRMGPINFEKMQSYLVILEGCNLFEYNTKLLNGEIRVGEVGNYINRVRLSFLSQEEQRNLVPRTKAGELETNRLREDSYKRSFIDDVLNRYKSFSDGDIRLICTRDNSLWNTAKSFGRQVGEIIDSQFIGEFFRDRILKVNAQRDKIVRKNVEIAIKEEDLQKYESFAYPAYHVQEGLNEEEEAWRKGEWDDHQRRKETDVFILEQRYRITTLKEEMKKHEADRFNLMPG